MKDKSRKKEPKRPAWWVIFIPLTVLVATFGGTLTGCGMTQSTVLKVPTPDYLPYCFFNLLSPLMSITICAIGYKIHRKAN